MTNWFKSILLLAIAVLACSMPANAQKVKPQTENLKMLRVQYGYESKYITIDITDPQRIIRISLETCDTPSSRMGIVVKEDFIRVRLGPENNPTHDYEWTFDGRRWRCNRFTYEDRGIFKRELCEDEFFREGENPSFIDFAKKFFQLKEYIVSASSDATAGQLTDLLAPIATHFNR